MSSICTLPAELLLSVFDLVFPIDEDTPWEQNDPWEILRLTHVCSFWRSVLISRPKYWTLIHLGRHPHRGMMLEYARRAKKHPITTRVVGTDGTDDNTVAHSPRKSLIPRAVSKKMEVLILTHPDQTNWLDFDDDGGELDLLYLGPLDGRVHEFEPWRYRFNPSMSGGYLTLATTLTCDCSVVLSTDSRTQLTFPNLRRMNIERVSIRLFRAMIHSIAAPSVVSLYCKKIYPGPFIDESVRDMRGVQQGLVRKLRHLSVVGDLWTFKVLEYCVLGIVSHKLEKLELYFCLRGYEFRDVDLRIWAAYALQARCISLTLEAEECVAVLDKFAKHNFARLECLQLRLPNYSPSFTRGLPEAYHSLRQFLTSYRGPRLKKLDVSALLVIPEDKGWLETRVEVLRRDEFDADEYDPYAESDEEDADAD